jgi:choline dehydrogenase-like flavoprotein
VFDDPVRGWEGVHQAYQVREFREDGILIAAVNVPPSLVAMSLPAHGRELGELMADYDRMVVVGCMVEDSVAGRVVHVPGLGAQAFYQISERDAERIVRGIGLAAQVMFAAGARRVLPPFAGAPILHSPDDVTRLLSRPVPKRSLDLFTVHLMGTARMSADPRHGVVSESGEFHGATGLYVADASVLPGPVGVNPMETIVALAMRTAERLIDRRAHLGI